MLFTILSLDGIVPQAISESLKGQMQHGIADARWIEVREKVYFLYFHVCFHIWKSLANSNCNS